MAPTSRSAATPSAGSTSAGPGSSGGVALDEYTEAETRDGYDVVEWLAAQPWCTGAVGMWGICYGGFTSIQVAKLRPPHLRAIVPIQATDDRYPTTSTTSAAAMTASELCQYAVSQVAMNAMPPAPAFRGDGWRTDWLERLEATPPWLFEWPRQQHDGPYWRRARSHPTTARSRPRSSTSAAGWTSTSMRRSGCRRAARAPSRTIVGNWVHGLPIGHPGPEHRLAPRDRPLLRSLAARTSRTAPTTSRRSPGSIASTRRPSRFRRAPGSWRAAAPTRTRDVERAVDFAGGSLPLVGRGRRGAGRADARPASTPSRTTPTVGTRAVAVLGRRRPTERPGPRPPPRREPGRPTPRSRSTEPLDILGLPAAVLHLAVIRPVATASSGSATSRPDGTSAGQRRASST